jgi:hypothetical protein
MAGWAAIHAKTSGKTIRANLFSTPAMIPGGNFSTLGKRIGCGKYTPSPPEVKYNFPARQNPILQPKYIPA